MTWHSAKASCRAVVGRASPRPDAGHHLDGHGARTLLERRRPGAGSRAGAPGRPRRRQRPALLRDGDGSGRSRLPGGAAAGPERGWDRGPARGVPGRRDDLLQPPLRRDVGHRRGGAGQPVRRRRAGPGLWAGGRPRGLLGHGQAVLRAARHPRRDEVLFRDGRVLDRYGHRCTATTAPTTGGRGTSGTSPSRSAPSGPCSSRESASPPWPAPSRRACCPPTSPTSGGSSWAPATTPPARASTWEGTSTTCSRPLHGRGADVCGKGAEAARLTALARYTVRGIDAGPDAVADPGHAQRGPAAPEQPGGRRQRRALRQRRLRQPAADPQRDQPGGEPGGHPPALLVQPDGTVRPVGTGGTLLGLFRNADLVDEALELHPGDVLVLYTDGVTEARGPDGELGEEGLTEVLRRCAGATARDLAGEVEPVVLAHQGGVAHDDIAILAVRAS
ncbi:MAG TPA: PP2C family protein-serine/threonine phosphatase [Acidimicrobiales bacterium]|nr:PP2C family protein-serine/threonine phosphatase [Acidimicrobiales bacterium]